MGDHLPILFQGSGPEETDLLRFQVRNPAFTIHVHPPIGVFNVL